MRYLMSRGRPGWEPPSSQAAVRRDGYFELWKVRLPPYTALADGDTVVLLDARRGVRRLVWELRVRDLLRQPYADLDQAVGILAAHLDRDPDELAASGDVVGRAPAGHLLAFRASPVRRLDIPLPAGVSLGALGGRHGWVPLDRLPAEALEAADLALK